MLSIAHRVLMLQRCSNAALINCCQGVEKENKNWCETSPFKAF